MDAHNEDKKGRQFKVIQRQVMERLKVCQKHLERKGEVNAYHYEGLM